MGVKLMWTGKIERVKEAIEEPIKIFYWYYLQFNDFCEV